MTKLRIKFEVVVEYDANPENYPDSARTPEQMLAVDLANADEDPFMMLGEDADWKITGEVVTGEPS